MKTTNYFKQYVSMSLVSLLLLTLCVFIWFNKPSDSHSKSKKQEIGSEIVEEKNVEVKANAAEEEAIQDFLMIIFDYDDRADTKRFDDLSNIATAQVIEQVKELFPKLDQEVPIKSNVSSIALYSEKQIEQDAEHRLMADVSMDYQVESNTMELTQLLQVTVEKEQIGNKETYIITDYKIVSSQTNMNEGVN